MYDRSYVLWETIESPGEIDVRREREALEISGVHVRGKATIRHPSMEPYILGMFHPLTQQMTGN